MRNISRFRLRAHTLKVEAAAWLEDGSCVCDQRPGEDMFKTRCMLFYFAKTIEFVSWGDIFPFCLHLFLRTFQQPNPFRCSRSTTNLFIRSFLSRTIDIFSFFLSLWIYLWLARPVSSRSAKQPGWRSSPIVTIVIIISSNYQCKWMARFKSGIVVTKSRGMENSQEIKRRPGP